jgi:hypothetical protein
LDGHDVIAFFDVNPSKVVGDAIRFLTELVVERGRMGRKEAFAELESWGAEHGLTPARTPEEASEIADAARAAADEAEDASS